MKTALVTGIAGQDGFYLAQLLLSKGYAVHGVTHPSAGEVDAATLGLPSDVVVHRGDVSDALTVDGLVESLQPTEVYHLAAVSDVVSCQTHPSFGFRTNILGTLHILEAVRRHSPHSRVVHASSGAIFGYADPPQDESTPLQAVNLYGSSKLAAHTTVQVYRQNSHVFATNAILFNHESPRRPTTFVTRRISDGVARIALGMASELHLGNLDGQRDWGYAPDYVLGMWLMLQQPEPDDFVLASGVSHTVRELAQEAFAAVGLDWQPYVQVDDRLLRAADRERLRGNPEKAESVLGWARSVDFAEMVRMMVLEDVATLRKQQGA